MNEIKVGEYVRTKQGYIAKLDKIDEDFMKFDDMIYCDYEETPLLHLNDKYGGHAQIKEILKHSPNIIDLIEEGDYVNGKYVYSIGTAIGNLPIINHTDGTFTPSNFIKSIVTKEQFQSLEYRLEE